MTILRRIVAAISALSVFAPNNGIIRHLYSVEMTGDMADPGQAPRGAPDLDPLWLMLDLTPEGRSTDLLVDRQQFQLRAESPRASERLLVLHH
jgi:predicted dithiol-disulfide oxidoreductase (DUF899 family)